MKSSATSRKVGLFLKHKNTPFFISQLIKSKPENSWGEYEDEKYHKIISFTLDKLTITQPNIERWSSLHVEFENEAFEICIAVKMFCVLNG